MSNLVDNYSPVLQADSPLDKEARELIRELNRREQEKALALPTDDPLDPKRRHRVELTWDEMWGQPAAIRETLMEEGEVIAEAAAYFAQMPLDRVMMVGCGDSLASMIAVRQWLETLLRVPTEPVQALDFVYYYYRPVNERTLVITLSSSGTTTRTVESLLLARAMGAKTLTLSNTEGSPLMNEADRRVLIHAERKGWPTQSSTAAMAVLYQFALELARRRDGKFDDVEIWQLEQALHATPDQIAAVLEAEDALIARLAEREAERSLYLFAGGGPSYASALFGAAKVKECSPDHAIPIPLEEFHHYNSQKAGDPLFIIAPSGPSLPRALDTAREGQRWGGQVYSIVTEGDETLLESSDAVITLPAVDERLAPMVYTIPTQLFAYHVAMAKFRLAERRIEPE